jgi:translocation and assembly module TamB
MKKALKYSLIVLGWLLVAVVAIVILAGLLIQTKPVKQRLAGFAEQKASEFINGNLTIGAIEGNFFTNLHLKNILLTNENDTVAFIAAIDARYNLWPLLHNSLQIHSAQITEPYVFLEQINDSTWNLQQLIKPTGQEPDTTDSGGSFNVDLFQFKIVEGHIKIESPDTLIPQEIRNLNTQLSFSLKEKRQELQLSSFSLVAKNPNVVLEKLSFELSRNPDVINLSGFYLKTAQNQLEGDVKYAESTEKESTASLQSGPLQLNEFEFYLPGISIPVSPMFTLDASMKDGTVQAIIKLEDQNQKIHLDLTSDNLPAFLLNEMDSILHYNLDGTFENIELAHWSGIPELDYLINGKLIATGKGTSLETAVVNLDGDFNDCVIQDKPVEKLLFNLDLDRGDLSGLAEGKGGFGEFRLTPEIQNLSGDPAYQFGLLVQNLDLAQLIGNDSLQSNINLEAKVEGRGFDPKTLSARANVVFSHSQMQQITLDTMLALIQYENENLQLDSVWLQTQSLTVHAHGNYSLRSNSDVFLSAELAGLDEFASFIPLEGLKTSGQIDAHLFGKVDSLKLETKIELDKSSYQKFTIEKLLVNANALLTASDTLVNAHILANELRNEDFLLDSVAFDVEAGLDSVFISGNLANKDLKSQLQTGIKFGEKMRLTLMEWTADYKNQHWALKDAPAIIEIDSLNYMVDNFILASDASDSAQYISAQGNISRNAAEDFDLKIENINLAQLAELFGQDLGTKGFFGMNLNLGGTATAPVIKGDFILDRAVLNGYGFTEFGGTVDYADERFNTEMKIVPKDSGRIELTGTIPLRLKLDSMDFNFNPKDSLDVKLTVDRFPLAVLQSFDENAEISGYLQGGVDVKGTVESPDPKGNLELKEAFIRIREYGIDYRDMAFNIEFLRDAISLDTFRIVTSDGQVTANGTVDFNSDFYKGDISQSKINFKFDDFNPVNHRQFNMQVSGDASLGGKKGEVVFDGDLNIPETEIYLPAVFNMMGKMNTAEIPKPILVEELERMAPDTVSAVADTTNTSANDSTSFTYFDDFTGKLRVKIPKNAWIKNEDMRIEISGDLELIKNEQFFEIFGEVEVVRGQYDLFGRRNDAGN